MEMEMEVSFPGGKRVDAEFNGYSVRTDQPPEWGGQGTVPEPFQYYLASLATCAGIYVLGFCQARGIGTEGLKLTQRAEWDEEKKRLARVKIEIGLPRGFPDKYRRAVARVADMCAVKKSILDPPEFIIEAV